MADETETRDTVEAKLRQQFEEILRNRVEGEIEETRGERESALREQIAERLKQEFEAGIEAQIDAALERMKAA